MAAARHDQRAACLHPPTRAARALYDQRLPPRLRAHAVPLPQPLTPTARTRRAVGRVLPGTVRCGRTHRPRAVARRPVRATAGRFLVVRRAGPGEQGRMGNQPVTTRTLLRGGLVADGIGDTTRPGNVLIDGPVITSTDAGSLSGTDCDVIDLAPGSVIC